MDEYAHVEKITNKFMKTASDANHPKRANVRI